MKSLMLLAALLSLEPGQEDARIYEAMVVPYASNGLEDWSPSEDRPRHVINVSLEGKLTHAGRVLEGAGGLGATLKDITAQMPTAPLYEGGPQGPAGSLLVRADLVGSFGPVLDILQAGSALNLREYHLAVGDIKKPRIGADGALLPSAGPERYLPLRLPADVGEGPLEAGTTLALEVKEPGRKLAATRPGDRPWGGEPGTRFRWDLAQRKVAYRLGGRETGDRLEFQKWLFGMRKVLTELPVQLEVGDGVTAAEAVNALDVLRGLGAVDIHLTRRK